MSDADQQAVMDHEEAMQLHKANLAGKGVSPRERARILETVIESELTTSKDLGTQGGPLGNLRAKDFPLANYDEEGDTVEFKWMSEILDIFDKARYPHPQSGLHGLARAWATGDTHNRLEPLQLDQFAEDEAYKLGVYSRAKRGESMAQQETSAKQVTETHAVRDDGSSSGGKGLLGRWRS